MGRPVSSALSVQNVLCSDGVKRTFRYYSPRSARGTVRMVNVPVTGDIRESKFGGYFFHADPEGQNYYLLPNEATVQTLYDELLSWLSKVKDYGVGEPDPMMIMRFCGFEVNEEEGWIDAPSPVPYDELQQGIPPSE